MHDLAWPIVVLFLVIAFLFLFRSQVGGFIDRTRSLKVPGIHAEGELAQVQTQAKDAHPPLIGGQEQLGTPLSDDVLSSMDQHFHRLIQQSVPNERNHLAWALRLLSHVAVQRDHEITMRLILASQLRALRSLNESGGFLKFEDLRPLYDAIAAERPDAYGNFPFERWWGYLVNRQLATSDTAGLRISAIGRSFLAYIAATGIRDPQGL